MTEPTNPLSSIESTVQSMGAAVQELTTKQARSIKRVRRLAFISLFGLFLSVILMIKINSNSNRIAAVQAEGEARGARNLVKIESNQRSISGIQQKVSVDALCPLYDIFLDSYAPASPQAKVDPAAYEQAFVILEKGATALGCKHVKRGLD